jgi:hypothetical protein
VAETAVVRQPWDVFSATPAVVVIIRPGEMSVLFATADDEEAAVVIDLVGDLDAELCALSDRVQTFNR